MPPNEDMKKIHVNEYIILGPPSTVTCSKLICLTHVLPALQYNIPHIHYNLAT